MDIKAVDTGEICDVLIKYPDVQFGELIKERVDGVLLVLIEYSHNGVFEVHKRNKSLVKARLEPAEIKRIPAQITLVFLCAAFPVPLVNIRPLHLIQELVCVLGKGLARANHGTAHLGDVFPLNPEHVLSAAFIWIKRCGFKHKRAGDVVRENARRECLGFNVSQHLPVGLSGIRGFAVFFCRYRVIIEFHARHDGICRHLVDNI